jgi:hypothetical protein
MCHRFNPTVNENVGYMFVVLDQDTYQPGDTIEGRLFFEVFMPCFQNRIMLKLEAVEQFPKRFTPKVFEKQSLLTPSDP